MCDFLSLVSDGAGKIYYFAQEQRKKEVKDRHGQPYKNYDSHTSIADYYGLDEDCCNKWEYNPFTDVLTADRISTLNDREQVLMAVNCSALTSLCGDYMAVRRLLVELLEDRWLDNHGPLPSSVLLFDTRDAARDAARDVARDVAMDAAWYAARDAAWDTARDAAWDTVRAAARDATLYAELTVVHDVIDHEHFACAKERMDVWLAGYGVFCDIDGVIYAYKRIM